jgi:large conductance mechanosensitive channel
MLKEFKAFILRGNVVDLAVGIVIGAAFTTVVNALVGSFLTPLIAAIFGKPNFADLSFTIHDSQFKYGLFLNAIIAFLLVAAALFFFVVKPINALTARSRREPPPEPDTTKCPECLCVIPAAARRRAYCTAVQPGAPAA